MIEPPQGTGEEKAEAAKVLVAVLEAVRIVAVLLWPVTPQLSARILAQLGLSTAPRWQPLRHLLHSPIFGWRHAGRAQHMRFVSVSDALWHCITCSCLSG